GVGAVGARLVDQDGAVLHDEFLQDDYGLPARSLGSRALSFHLAHPNASRDCPAVAAACLLTPRALFMELGGFDEMTFPRTYCAVDYCYRLQERGYRSVLCPDATLIWHPDDDRPVGDEPSRTVAVHAEIAAFRGRYSGRVERYLNPNLVLDNGRIAIRPYRHPLPHSPAVRVAAVSHNLEHQGAPNVL